MVIRNAEHRKSSGLRSHFALSLSLLTWLLPEVRHKPDQNSV